MKASNRNKSYQNRYCPYCQHETYFSGDKCECCKKVIGDSNKTILIPSIKNEDNGSLSKKDIEEICNRNNLLRSARELAYERMYELCVSCIYKKDVECPLESVQDLETLYALVPQNCHKFKPKFNLR